MAMHPHIPKYLAMMGCISIHTSLGTPGAGGMSESGPPNKGNPPTCGPLLDIHPVPGVAVLVYMGLHHVAKYLGIWGKQVRS